ncbi:MAG: hypothetical protein E7401_02400 [Ruminococcaceae bacterium]|nr:hypothetical protein [Oscillospiraceae bacterium]
MALFLRRLIEHFSVGILTSVLCTCFLLNVVDTTTKAVVFLVMLLCITLHIIHFCSCLAEQWSFTFDPIDYYVINIAVSLLYAAANITMAVKNVEPIYTYIFLPYKMFTIFDVSKVTSAVLVNLIMIFFIIIVPIASRPRGKNRFRGY